MIPFDDNLHNIDTDLLQLFKSVIQSIKISAYEILYNGSWILPKFRSKFGNDLNKQEQLKLLENQFNQFSGADWASISDFLADNIEDRFRNEMQEFGLFQLRDYSIREDNHPIPAEHLIYLKTVLPEFIIDTKTEQWINNYKLFDSFDKHQPTNRL